MSWIDEKADFTLDQLIGSVLELGRRSCAHCTLAFSLLASIGTVGDLLFPSTTSHTMVRAVLQLLVCFWLARELALQSGVAGQQGAKSVFGAYFVASLLIGVGLSIGYLLLVVPGIVLTVRWLVAIPLVFAARANGEVRGPLSRSWDMTGRHFWKLLAAFGIAIVLMGLAIAARSYPDVLADNQTRIASFAIANAAAALATIFEIVLGFAAFALMQDDKDDLARIFS